MSPKDIPPANAVGRLSAVSLASVLDQSVDCVKLISLDGKIQYMNGNGLSAMEVDDFCTVEGLAWTDLWPEDARRLIVDSYPLAATGETVRFRAFCPTAKGTPRWWDVSVSRVTDDRNELAGFLSVSRDVTANERSRAALAVAAAELKHRLKNTYQMIASLLVVTAQGNAGNEEFARQMSARLSALSSAQLLFADADAPCELADLIPALISPFASAACAVTFSELPQLLIDQPQADAIALVIGELAVNSAKHGALAHGGTIGVNAACEGANLSIVWHESGNRAVAQRSREGGQGMNLMEQIMHMRGGSFAVAWEDHGLTATLSFNLTA